MQLSVQVLFSDLNSGSDNLATVGGKVKRSVRRRIFLRLFAGNSDVNLLTMNGNLLGRVDADSNRIAFDLQDADFNVITDADAFVRLSREDKHVRTPFGRG